MIRQTRSVIDFSLTRRRAHLRRGLTRVEIAVVLVCLLVLLLLIVPGLMHQRETQRKVACQERLRNLYVGLAAAAQDNENRLPGLVHDGIPWTQEVLRYLDPAGSILDQLTDAPLNEQPPVHASIFLCPNGKQYAAGRNCYVVNGGWGDFEYDPDTDFVTETKPHTVNLDWNADGTISDQERHWTRASGVVWRSTDTNWSWKFEELDAADGRGQTILLTETQNSRSWMSVEAFDLAVLVGREFIQSEDLTNPFDVETDGLGPYSINSSRSGRLGRCPAPSSWHPSGVNILFADGGFRTLSDEIDPLLYLRMMTPAGTLYGEFKIKQRDPESVDAAGFPRK